MLLRLQDFKKYIYASDIEMCSEICLGDVQLVV